jgi:hypothetical protein
VDHGIQLANQAGIWQTPPTDSFRSRGGDRKDEMGLDQQSRFWATPNARDVKNPGSPDGERSRRKADLGWTIDLNDQSAHWPTPATRDYKGANSELHVMETGGGRKHMDQLPNFVAHGFLFGRPDLETPVDGEKSSPDGPNSLQLWPTPNATEAQRGSTTHYSGDPKAGRTLKMEATKGTKKKLNPKFVAWLMSLPPDYLEPTRCGALEMQSWLSAQRRHLSRLLDGQE